MTDVPRDDYSTMRRLRHNRGSRAARHFLAYALCRGLFFALALLPRRWGQAIGSGCGMVFYAISPRHRRIALANLALAFGDSRSPRERARLARASFANAGMIMADAAYFPRTARLPLEQVVVYEGVEHLRAAIAEGRGALVFSGHFGHWEMLALLQARIGVPFTMVVRPLMNQRLNAFLTGLRSLTGNEVIAKYDAARTILRALHAGRAIALMIDQNVRGEGGLFVDFFGKPASTTPALATFALKTRVPIVPVFSYPLPDGRVLIRYGRPLRAERKGSIGEDILSITQTCTALLEEEIRRHPEFWLWMHNRWRTRPPSTSGGEPRRDEPVSHDPLARSAS